MMMLTAGLALLFVNLAFAASITPSRFYKPGNVTLGVLLPVHTQTPSGDCGALYYLGLGYIEAIAFAIERINNSTQLLPGITLGLDVWDYCYNPNLAMKWAQRITTNNDHNKLVYDHGVDRAKVGNITDPIVGVIGSIESGSTSFISGLLQVVDIPIVSPFSTSEELSSPYYSSFFRTIPPDGQQSMAMADVIEHFKWKYVAAIAHDGSYGQYGIRALEREAYNRRTFCIAFVEFFTRSGYKGKIETTIAKLKREEHIQVIVFWSNYDQADVFLEEARKQRLFGRTFLLSEAMATFGPHVLQEYSSVLGGSLAIMPHEYNDPVFENHLRNLTPAKTKIGGNPWWEEFWKTKAMYTSSSAVSGDKSSVIGDGKITDIDFEELFSAYVPYVTDSVYAVAHGLHLLFKCKENISSDYHCPETQTLRPDPGDVLNFMKGLNFKGVTGTVRFKHSGNPTNAFYDLMNFRKNNKTGAYFIHNIGSWRRDVDSKPELHVDDHSIEWNTKNNDLPTSECSKPCLAGFKQTATTPCCWECFRCPDGRINPFPGSPNCTACGKEQRSNHGNTRCEDLPLMNIRWDDVTAVVVVLLAALGFGLSLAILRVFAKHHDTPIIKGSNRELSYLLLLIIILSLLLPILHLVQPTSDRLCYLIQPWRYLTCTACVSVLFLKTNRLVRAFQTSVIPPWFKKYILHHKRQLAVVFFLNLIQLVLTSLWLVLDPPYRHKDIKVQQHMFIKCNPSHSSTGLIIRAIMFGYFIFLSLLCTIYAFKARKLPENFNEARYIGFSMYILLLSWIAYYPVDSALEGFYITIVACSTALVIAYGLLGCMFFPKVFIILRHPEQNTLEAVKAEVSKFSLSMTPLPTKPPLPGRRVTPTLS